MEIQIQVESSRLYQKKRRKSEDTINSCIRWMERIRMRASRKLSAVGPQKGGGMQLASSKEQLV